MIEAVVHRFQFCDILCNRLSLGYFLHLIIIFFPSNLKFFLHRTIPLRPYTLFYNLPKVEASMENKKRLKTQHVHEIGFKKENRCPPNVNEKVSYAVIKIVNNATEEVKVCGVFSSLLSAQTLRGKLLASEFRKQGSPASFVITNTIVF